MVTKELTLTGTGRLTQELERIFVTRQSLTRSLGLAEMENLAFPPYLLQTLVGIFLEGPGVVVF